MNQRYDAIILGAGAAGLMCAIEAGKRGRRVLVLERAERIGKKILISGGGRCNFTNLHTAPENFLSNNPHFAKSALARYTPADFIALVEKHRIPYHEKKLGQLFCDRSAHDITGMLEQECRAAGVEIKSSANVREVSKGSDFAVQAEEAVFHAPRLVVATGGLSIPKIGATSFGYDLARQFGLKIQAPRPALVPVVFIESERKRWCDLAGVSTEVVASVPSSKQLFREKMLFTHRGISGPAILQISSYWNGAEPVLLDLAPDRDLIAELRGRGQRDASGWKALLREVLPRRLADRWVDVICRDGARPVSSATGDAASRVSTPGPSRSSDHSDSAFADAERQLHAWNVLPEGSEGYAKAEVTAGGVDTDELSAKTMESRRIPGLYLIGEVVDVTGQLGGFNFQWAWASGFCAGQAL